MTETMRVAVRSAASGLSKAMKARISWRRARANGDQTISSGPRFLDMFSAGGAISAPRTWPRRLVGVHFTADTFRRRQLTIRAPGKQPGFHVFVPDVVAGLHLAVALAYFREHALLVCDVGFDGIGNQEIGAPARGFGQFCEPALGGGLEAYAKSRASCVRHEHRITPEGRISKLRNGHVFWPCGGGLLRPSARLRL